MTVCVIIIITVITDTAHKLCVDGNAYGVCFDVNMYSALYMYNKKGAVEKLNLSRPLCIHDKIYKHTQGIMHAQHAPMLPEMYHGSSFSLGIIVLRSRWVASVVTVMGQGWGRVVSSVTVDHCWKSLCALKLGQVFFLLQFKVVSFCSENPS